jgi:hypothetical protein
MAVKKNQSGLPKGNLSGGWMPDEDPEFAPELAKLWSAQFVSDEELEMAIPGLSWRGSWASARCDRQLWYKMTKTPSSNPITLADNWRFWLGKLVHEHFQAAILERLSERYTVEAEAVVDLRPAIDGSARMDLFLREPGSNYKIALELKTINGMGFKSHACTFRGKAPEGPRYDHVVQSAVAARALDCDEIKIVYLSLENVGKELATFINADEIGRFAAEWTLTRDEYAPIADLEARRVAAVSMMAKSDILTDRQMWDPELPQTGRVIVSDPKKGTGLVTALDGTKLDTFKTWRCHYCDFQDTCAGDP